MKNLYLGKQIIFAKLCLIVLLCSYSKLYGQATYTGGTLSGNILYYSSQNGGMNSLTGTLSISADAKSSGNATIATTGPVQATINPNDLSHAGPPNHDDLPISKTWNGTITVDAATAPVAGSSAAATVTGHATITYSIPGPGTGAWNVGTTANPQWHHYEHDTHDETVNLTVYSILDSISGPDSACSGTTKTYSVTTYPSTGGTVSWSTGATGNTVDVVVFSDQVLTCTFTIEGVSYTATKNIYVKPIAPAVNVGASIPDPGPVIAEGSNYKTQSNNVMSHWPGTITFTGPIIDHSGTVQDCCRNDSVISGGKTSSTLSVTAGVIATGVPILPPPLSGSYSKNVPFFGVTVSVGFAYGLLLNINNATFTGSGTAIQDKCSVPEFCYKAGIGINAPLTISASISGSICINTVTSSTCAEIVAGVPCGVSTYHYCGYCDAHMGLHPWACFLCSSITFTVASLSSTIFGHLGYKTCESPHFEGNIGMGAVTFTFLNFTLSGSTFGVPPFEVWHGGNYYSTP